MAHGVAEESRVVPVLENPDLRPVGWRPFSQRGVAGRESNRQGVVELEQCLGGLALEPEGLGALQGGAVVARVIACLAEGAGVSCPQRYVCGGKVRAGGAAGDVGLEGQGGGILNVEW